MRWKSKAWAVLGTVAAVEELKEKNLSKWRSCGATKHALIINIMPLFNTSGKIFFVYIFNNGVKEEILQAEDSESEAIRRTT
ncbi:hypothetical protein GBA52_011628 [Prunus armeniaca]|nr:hypothetical protein GBA52_011628 [Prunus armeniaca]